jgi:hypothetical protein
MIVKKIKTYISLGKLGLSQRKVGFPFGIRILRCPREQLKPFFPKESIMSHREKEFKFSNYLREQL